MTFFDLKGIVETVLERLGFPQSEYLFSAHPESGGRRRSWRDAVRTPVRARLIGRTRNWVSSENCIRRSETHLDWGGERVVLAELKIAPLVRPSWRLSQMAPDQCLPSGGGRPGVRREGGGHATPFARRDCRRRRTRRRASAYFRGAVRHLPGGAIAGRLQVAGVSGNPTRAGTTT